MRFAGPISHPEETPGGRGHALADSGNPINRLIWIGRLPAPGRCFFSPFDFGR
jgi:hypothetical protein